MKESRYKELAKELSCRPQTIGNHRLYFIPFKSAVEFLQDRIDTNYPEIEMKVGNITIHLIDKDTKKLDKVLVNITKDAMKELGIEYESTDTEEAGSETCETAEEGKAGTQV